MAKKSLKDAAAAGTSVFEQIASGSAKDVLDVKNVNNTQNVQNANNAANVKKSGRPKKYDGELVRLNLKVPADIKEYLTIAAAKASIAQRRQISFTEYLCELVAADREQHNNE